LPEVAADLGIPLGTAKSRLHRALGVLRSSAMAESDAPATVPAATEGRFA
jgi:DNA-directed RNA polymerase specialized sigma24 family protein